MKDVEQYKAHIPMFYLHWAVMLPSCFNPSSLRQCITFVASLEMSFMFVLTSRNVEKHWKQFLLASAFVVLGHILSKMFVSLTGVKVFRFHTCISQYFVQHQQVRTGALLEGWRCLNSAHSCSLFTAMTTC